VRQVAYVTRIQTVYYNPQVPGMTNIEADSSAGDRVIARYCAHGATTKSLVFLTEDDFCKAQAAAADLTLQVIG